MGLLASIAGGVAEKTGGFLASTAEENIRSQIAEDRQRRLEEHRVKLQEDATIRGEQRGIENRRTERGIIHDETVARAPALRDIKVADQRAVNEENTRAEIERFEKMAPLKRADAIATATETLKAQATPEMLAAARKIAQAKHIVDPSYSVTQDADGTLRTFDSKSGKMGPVLKDPETGEPIVRKSDEQVRAAREVIAATGAEIRSADAALATARQHYRDQKPSDPATDPAVRKRAEEDWANAQKAYQIRIDAARADRALATAALSTKLKPRQGAAPAEPAAGAINTPPAAAAPAIEFVRDANGKLVPKQK